MKKACAIKVKGDVQRSAFRRFVKQLAKKHNLFGSVENLDNYDDDVMVICEGEKKNLQNFLHRLKNLTPQNKEETTATITAIEIAELPFTGEFDNFKIIRGPEEIAERLDEGLVIMNRGFKEQKAGFDKMDGNFKVLNGKLDGNFESLKEETKKGFSETSKNFKSLDTKYGTVSDILIKMNNNLEKIVRKI